ncbi:MAG: hypothetical protein NT133_09830 [Alphaproteobacteria bacterium]|nr:hypothetical protein [Alphaproteobacteria bacterium]
MTTLLDITLPRTLDALVTRLSDGNHRGHRVEAWLFDNAAARRVAEARLAGVGVHARIRSAYKPLVHHFLEEAPAAGPVSIALPNHPSAAANRFRLDAYRSPACSPARSASSPAISRSPTS